MRKVCKYLILSVLAMACGCRSAEPVLPGDRPGGVGVPSNPVSAWAELSDASIRICGAGLDLRWDAGGVILEKRGAKMSLRSLSKGELAEFDATARTLSVDGVAKAWGELVELADTSAGTQWYCLQTLEGDTVVVVLPTLLPGMPAE